jgi:hypothetical protein
VSLVFAAASCGTARKPGIGTAGPLPGVSLRPAFERFGLPPKDQSPRGCCSLFALCGVLEFEWARANGGTPALRLSEEYLNWASHQTNGRGTDGSFFADALRGLATFGVCRDELLPYAREFRSDLGPSAAAFEDAAARRDVRALWIKPWDVTTGMTAEMLAAIRDELSDGHPVAIGMRWPHQETYTPAGLLVVPPPEGVFDGHSIALVGWQEDPAAPGGGVFVFRNSFGPGWREGGYGRLPYAYVAAYGNDALSLRLGGGTVLPCNRGACSPIEFEALPPTDVRGCQPATQAMAAWGAARWSGGAQLFCGAGPGASLTFALDAPVSGRYRLGLFATRAPDFGIARVFLDDRRLADDADLYAPVVQPTGRLELGTVRLAAGGHRLRVEVVGRNPASGGSFLGLDCLELVPVEAGAL